MSGHEGIKSSGGTVFYFGTKAAAPAERASKNVNALLSELSTAMDACLSGMPFDEVSLDRFGLDNEVLEDVLGEGEVRLWIQEPDSITEITESVMPGIWRLKKRNAHDGGIEEMLDVGAFPRLVDIVANRDLAADVDIGSVPPGTMSAGPILQEIKHHMQHVGNGVSRPPHTIVLSNLPMSPEDTETLAQCLGEGPIAGGSKGYSTTRVRSTFYRYVWRTNYLNSDGQVIYDAIEIAAAPLALAAPREDIKDGRKRLTDLVKIYGSDGSAI